MDRVTRSDGQRRRFPYEHRRQQLLPRPAFYRRAGWHTLVALVIILIAVSIGTLGYKAVADLNWIDAFLNASMILAGMGPVDRMMTTGAKLFAALYALFSGLVFIGVTGVALAPWVHRLFHLIHIDDDD
jgi:hypothetical protein